MLDTRSAGEAKKNLATDEVFSVRGSDCRYAEQAQLPPQAHPPPVAVAKLPPEPIIIAGAMSEITRLAGASQLGHSAVVPDAMVAKRSNCWLQTGHAYS